MHRPTPVTALNFRFGSLSFLQRTIGHQVDVSMKLLVYGFNALENRPSQFDGRERTALDQFLRFMNGQIVKRLFRDRHGILLSVKTTLNVEQAKRLNLEQTRYYFPVHSGRNTPATSSAPRSTECSVFKFPMYSSMIFVNSSRSPSLGRSPSRASSACKLCSINLSIIILLKT